MKKHMQLVLIPSFLFRGSAVSQTDLTGTWQGKVASRPNELIQFIITKKANGSYAALFVSPHNINHANAASFAGGRLIIDVHSLPGFYSGTVGKDNITGEWRQQNSVFPLILTLQKPDVGTLKPLLGEWTGTTWLAGAVKRKRACRFRARLETLDRTTIW
jgi:hypothetical protein